MKKFIIIVEFQIKPGDMAHFMPLMMENAKASLHNEPGCQRFDVLTTDENPDHVLLYEIYDDERAFEKHLQTPHFLAFRDRVASYVAHKAEKKYWLESAD